MPRPAAGLVSAIVPVFNGERFLREALDSIAAQDYAPLEMIVVDDGSTDDSALIAQRCAQAHYLFQPNQGCGPAKNTGLSAAHGEFIAFLDADDLWLPGKIRQQVEALRRAPEAGITTGRMTFFFEPGVSRPAWVPAAFLTEPQPAYLPSGLLIRRSVFDQVGIFDSTFALTNDYEWLTRARDAGVPEVLTPHVVVRRRVHDGNLTYRTAELSEELLRMLRTSVHRKKLAQTGGVSQ